MKIIVFNGNPRKENTQAMVEALKAVLFLSSGSDGVYEATVAQFKAYLGYTGIEAAGIITAHGDENKSGAKLGEIREFAKGL